MPKKQDSEDAGWAREQDDFDFDDDLPAADAKPAAPAAGPSSSPASSPGPTVASSMARMPVLQGLISKTLQLCSPPQAGKRIPETQLKSELIDTLALLHTELNLATKVLPFIAICCVCRSSRFVLTRPESSHLARRVWWP
jgi:hypothetical protein